MKEAKKYYWIKLKTDFFNQDTIDFLLSQENGCEYIVLYQMLCLNTANNEGKLSSSIGEIIVPYDAKKIVRDCKYFEYDTVVIALELFKKLGLIYQEEDEILKIADYDKMIGSESATKSAIKKREQRLRKKIEDKKGDKKGTNCPIEIEYRDKSIDIDIYNNIYKEEINKEEINKEEKFNYSKEIIDYLNSKTGKHFRYTQNTTKLINSKLKEGFTLDDFKIVIDKKVKDWGNNNEMQDYLRPITLFGSKFESYLNQKEKKRNGFAGYMEEFYAKENNNR